MKNIAIGGILALLLALAASSALAQQGMMRQQGGMAADGKCPYCPRQMDGGMGMRSGSMKGEMHEMMMGGMGMMKGMGPSFYLDMQDRLGLSPEQAQQLRNIRRDFRRDFIRRSADLKIAMLDLGEAFQGDWSIEQVEKQLRQMQQQRTDLMVQYLKARKQAEQILNEEQRQMLRRDMEQESSM
ncbi:MAG: Spy/CpxP family protein refolding chaperone [Desulfuromonadales bacterium]|jgi:Spy/CpxP family protein refolding chaperone